MSAITSVDIRLLDEAFEMKQGYVLAFTDRTMGDFFLEKLNLDIDHEKWKHEGTSKAKRLRYFLKSVDDATALRTIVALWEHRQTSFPNDGVSNAIEGRIIALIQRLGGNIGGEQTSSRPEPALNTHRISVLREELRRISNLLPHERGYAFENFLKGAFDLYGMDGRAGFRLTGEQIDGSFKLDSDVYLLEAKWHSERTELKDLLVFEGKLDSRAKWARGLFVSYTGFTDGGLTAFGRGKRTICMCGYDFDEMLRRELPLDHVLREKARKAVETGNPYTLVRDF